MEKTSLNINNKNQNKNYVAKNAHNFRNNKIY